jgi:decaprenylphospho-beta-D-erythro-pentofuranosid-2-ulose 2-reductase
MNIVIVGATSAIAKETARLFAFNDKAAFLLVGRFAERLENLAADLRTRGAAKVEIWAGDLLEARNAEAVFAQAAAALGRIDLVFIAQGSLTDEGRAATDGAYRAAQAGINFLSPAAFAYAAAELFRRQGGGGQIAMITSVAGERGRARNFFYGSCKASLIAFSQGLRASLFRDGITVTELRPGGVDTPMTAGMRKGLLFASAPKAGRVCYEAIQARRAVVYVPGYWRIIMAIVRAIPERFFQRMKF